MFRLKPCWSGLHPQLVNRRDARYAALGVLDDEGRLKQFITVGMTDEEIKRSHPPVGLGLAWRADGYGSPLARAGHSGSSRNRSVFPSSPQNDFVSGGADPRGDKQLGQIYLTEKIDAPEFTSDDEMIIQMLATYAATAITNARLI
jgi:two-component system, NarL family, sensor histidine kinase DevS